MNSIEKSIQILNYLSNMERSVRLSEISSRLSLPKSTVHRILKSFLKHDLIYQDKETSKYRLGFRVLEYSNSFYKSFDLRQITKPILKKLCTETGLTSFLTSWYNGHSICIDSFTPYRNTNTNLFVEIGKEMPFHCASSSKVMMAYQSPEEIDRIINETPITKYTSQTITEPEKLKKHFNEIREKGYAICNEELEEGIKAIAAPIKNVNGKVIASITITGVSKRISSNNIEELIKAVTSSALEISAIIGYKDKDH